MHRISLSDKRAQNHTRRCVDSFVNEYLLVFIEHCLTAYDLYKKQTFEQGLLDQSLL